MQTIETQPKINITKSTESVDIKIIQTMK